MIELGRKQTLKVVKKVEFGVYLGEEAGVKEQEQIIHGTIDFFTKTEYHKTIDDIQAALTASPRIGWNLSSVQYEDETNLIHYEWEFWVV